MDKTNKLNEAIALLGGRRAFCEALSRPGRSISPQMLWNWLNRDQTVPAQYCPDVERLTNGGVVCEDFWPDTDWAYIRDNPKPPARIGRAKRRSVPPP